MRGLRSRAWRPLAAMAALSATSCGGNPYALSLDSISERAPLFGERDIPAAIEVSPPQIYARETLINDRRKERDYLDNLLSLSADPAKVRFDPQLRRELTELTSIGLALSGSYDPASVNTYTNQRRLDEIEGRRAQLEKQLEIRRLEQQIANLESGGGTGAETGATSQATIAPPPGGSAPGGAGGTGGTTPQQPAAGGAVPQPTTGGTAAGAGAGAGQATPAAAGQDSNMPETIEVVQKLRTILTDLRGQLDKPTPLPPTALGAAGELKADPREEFRDRQAYRSDIRSALSEAELDDIHDQYGRSLYRMQFRTTVMPGRKKDKWGIAQLRVLRPTLAYDELKSLYNTWLAHSTYRLNISREVGDPARSNIRARDYETLAASTGLFDVVRVYYSPRRHGPLSDPCQLLTTPYEAAVGRGAEQGSGMNGGDVCDSLKLAVPPGQMRYVHPVLPGLDWFLINHLNTKISAAVSRGGGNPLRGLGLASCELPQQLSFESLLDKKIAPNSTDSTKQNSRSIGYSASALNRYIQRLEMALEKKPSDRPRELRKLEQDYGLEFFQGIDQIGRYYLRSGEYDKYGDDLIEYEKQLLLWLGELADQSTLENILNLLVDDLSDDYNIATPSSTKIAFAVIRVSSFLGVAESILTAINGLVARRDMDPTLSEKAVLAASAYEETIQAARNIVNEVNRSTPPCPNNLLANIANRTSDLIPTKFCSLVSDQSTRVLCEKLDQSSLKRMYTLGGDPYVYAAQPLELAQQISTVASAAEAIQLGLALRAALPTEGVNARGAFDLASAALGKVDAIERAPTVVGFARNDLRGPFTEQSNGPSTPDREPNDPPVYRNEFGWVFGPRVRIDPERSRLDLVQQLATYNVTADVSLPSFWPRVTFTQDSAWVGNWHNGELLVTDSRPGRQVSVDLPKNRADYDSLTAYLANKATGRDVQLTRIDRVEPSSPSLCDKGDLTILVYGANVWRSTELYLQGVPAKRETVMVLPDMEGVRASFDLAQLQRAAAGDDLKLTVWTRNGFDERRLPIVAGKDCAPVRNADATAGVAAILSVTPSTVSACDTDASLLVVSRGLGSVGTALFGGERVNLAPDDRLDPPTSLGGDHEFTLVKVGKKGTNTGLERAPLTLIGDRGVATFPVARKGEPKEGCKPEPAVDPTKPVIAKVTEGSGDAENTFDVCKAGPRTLVVTGTALGGTKTVTLSSWPGGKVLAALDTSLTLTFPNLTLDINQGATVPATLELLGAGGTKLAEHKLTGTCLKKPVVASGASGAG